MTPHKPTRLFSLQEANALIPELEKLLKNIQAKKETYARAHDTLFMHELVCAAERSNGFLGEDNDLESNIHILEEAIEALAKDVDAIFGLGCALRSLEKGQVDFLGEYEGQQVYFSWLQGEPVIRYFCRLNNLKKRIPL